MKQISITLDAREIISVEKAGDKDAIAKVKDKYLIFLPFCSNFQY
jgi:hypothetical protein